MNINVRLATSDDAHLPAFDNTKLSAVNTCPTWGILRYHKHKRMPENGRSFALEAGGAMHEVFAAVRLIQLRDYMNLPYHFEFHGNRLFGTRFESMKFYLEEEDEDQETRQINFCLQALHTSGYEDDLNDKKRTLANMEACAIAYFNDYDFNKYPIWISDLNDPTKPVGIEVPFDLVVTIDKDKQYRFTGKIDGLHVFPDGEICIQENKTTSVLTSTWNEQWIMAHQVTGYFIAAALITGKPCYRGYVRGLQIPLKKMLTESICSELVTRTDHKFEKWFEWFAHTVNIVEQFESNIINAPQYTHSCYRFFRSCAFMPFCDAPLEDKQGIIDEMIHDEWSPLNEEGAE